jgi:hypothetical protein
MPASNAEPLTRPSAVTAILGGGLIAGTLDGLDAAVFYKLSFGVPITILFQHIASGLLGRRAFHMGWPAVFLGIALHFTIALGAAAVFYSAARMVPAFYRSPYICGPVFGIAVYTFMHYIVVPLSAITPRTVPVTTFELIDQLFSHMFFVGLPIAVMTRRSARST